MCDTLGAVCHDRALFAKNSDRSPNEPQVTEWYPASDSAGKAQATYIEITRPAKTHAFVLSRPVWLWGGEMGVNEHGVCIGNEAVFTKGRYADTGLTGMDLLRLGLEQGDTAAAARDVILAYLEQYGQGGDCGYDHRFCYDNAFLIMDRSEVIVLETAGREWVWKTLEKGSLSNRLSIGFEGEAYSGGHRVDFKARHFEPLYSHFSGSAKRLAQTTKCLEGQPDLAGMIRSLRRHRRPGGNPLQGHSVDSICMHAGGLVGDQTTASMAVSLGKEIDLWVTGSSTPCISFFKPYRFGNPPETPVFGIDDERAGEYWQTREHFHRAAVGYSLPAEFYRERDGIEGDWIAATATATAKQMVELQRQAVRCETDFYDRWRKVLPEKPAAAGRLGRYWQHKNQQRKTPARSERKG